jgi:hypothetical protein
MLWLEQPNAGLEIEGIRNRFIVVEVSFAGRAHTKIEETIFVDLTTCILRRFTFLHQ